MPFLVYDLVYLGLFKNLCQTGKNIGEKDRTLDSLIKQLTEVTLSAEINSHLTRV
jgi:hypothetical protein